MADWQYLSPYGQGQSGSPTYWGGGAQQVFMRDQLDSMRSRVDGKVPEAEYPDGYLGTIQSRREDRLLDSLKNKVNQKAYQRGVHKGERIEPGDYEWPAEFHPMLGLELEAAGRKFAPIQTMQERMMTNDGRANPLSRESPASVAAQDPRRMAYLRNMAPGWR